ncbi:DNA-deoxyinosine glycosylase [Sphingosinicella rhizophila]|uniref:DNA-deoxyinosine glycosylase n=1 Tax=Sphingosinicella rhizophila TaxID=3050082 RepID=A0ABU3Q992_9SPHN|nr:DNA-deoxyinosine glycosylase [Sphingosinicella sp. GR2756]MDT9599964.1 DNA-deoxyinosine glycosylase [Sphingosinicella sp. GR2756]
MGELEAVLKRSFPPVADERTRLLVLGSLPGEESLAQGRYYAHPRNQFWKLMGAVIGSNLDTMDYRERLKTLRDAGVGLWDVVGSATRKGSLDTNIRGHQPNPLAELTASLPHLAAVAFNGGKAATIGTKLLAPAPFALVPLPSSSPAFTLALAAKNDAWIRLRTFLSG